MKLKFIYLLIGVVGGILIGAAYVKLTEVRDLKVAVNAAYPPLPEKTYEWTGYVKETGDTFVIADFDVIVRRYPTADNPKHVEIKRVKLLLDEKTTILKFGPQEERPDGSGGKIIESKQVPASFKEIRLDDYLDVTIDGDFKTATEAKATKILIVGPPR